MSHKPFEEPFSLAYDPMLEFEQVDALQMPQQPVQRPPVQRPPRRPQQQRQVDEFIPPVAPDPIAFNQPAQQVLEVPVSPRSPRILPSSPHHTPPAFGRRRMVQPGAPGRNRRRRQVFSSENSSGVGRNLFGN